jgi:hypothetical protein
VFCCAEWGNVQGDGLGVMPPLGHYSEGQDVEIIAMSSMSGYEETCSTYKWLLIFGISKINKVEGFYSLRVQVV